VPDTLFFKKVPDTFFYAPRRGARIVIVRHRVVPCLRGQFRGTANQSVTRIC